MPQNNKNQLVWTHAWPFNRTNEPCSCAMPDSLSKDAASDCDQLQIMAARLLSELESRNMPFVSMNYVEELTAHLKELSAHICSFNHMLLLGIGGSALGARALQKAFYPQQDWPGHHSNPSAKYLWIADNIDPESLPQWFERLPAEQTLVVVTSKSGGTIETMAQYFLAEEWLRNKLGSDYKRHLLLITDKDKGFLRERANAFGLAALPVPAKLGGRYSVLSAVGLVPAVFLGLQWESLLKGAKDLFNPLNQARTYQDMERAVCTHPAWALAVWAKAMQDQGLDELIYFTYVPKLATFGPWFAQLWAESLGKSGKGSMPLPATGVTDQHSLLQMFLDGPRNKACLFVSSDGLPDGPRFPAHLDEGWSYLADKNLKDLLLAETLGSRMALAERGTPLLELRLAKADEYDTGKMIALLGLATVFTGWLMQINPLDQPAVELGKRLAKASLGSAGLSEERETLAKFRSIPEQTLEF